MVYGDGETLGEETLESNVRGQCHFVLSVCSYELWLMCINWLMPIDIPLVQETSNKELLIILHKH